MPKDPKEKLQLDAEAFRDEAQSLTRNIRRFPEFCRKCIKIQPAEGAKIIPFILNEVQKWYFENHLMPDWLAGKPIRHIILKARQEGFTTIIAAFTFWNTIGHTNWNSTLIGKNSEQAEMIFEMTIRMRDNLPVGDLMPHFLVNRDRAGYLEFKKPDPFRFGKRLQRIETFKVDLDSRIRVLSGQEKGEIARAGTNQTVHGSEAAYWPSLLSSIASLVAVCHYRPETSIFIETTANGFNEFYNFWQDTDIASVPGVPEYWKKIFVPWYWHSRYELHDEDIEKKFVEIPRLEGNAEYEQKLFNIILTDETIEEVTEERAWAKIFWRRLTLAAMRFDINEFNKEYPATPTEAFVATGRPAFSRTGLQKMELDIRPPMWKGHIWIKKKKVEMEKAESGSLEIWERPQRHDQYVVCGDVAEGKAVDGVSEAKSKFDYHSAHVLKFTPFPPAEQVATWHGTCEPHLFADKLVALAIMYNRALLGWEVNSVGHGLIYHVTVRHRYNNLYRRVKEDEGGQIVSAKVGWFTSRGTKHTLVSTGKEFVRDKLLKIHDEKTLNEMKAYSDLGDGKYGAIAGHDDRAVALMIGCVMGERRLTVFKRQKERSEGKEQKKKHEQQNPVLAGRNKKGSSPILGSEF